MRITISADVGACILAGIEPASQVEVDLAALSVGDRQAIAAALAAGHELCGVPTPEGIVAAAKAAIAGAADAEQQAKLAKAVERAECEAALAAYETLDPAFADEKWGGEYGASRRVVKYVQPPRAMDCGYSRHLDLTVRWEAVTKARKAEAEAVNVDRYAASKAAHDAAAAAAENERQMGIAARAAMTMDELGVILGRNKQPLALISDDGETVVIQTGDHLAAAVPLAKPEDSKLRVLVGGAVYDARKYAVSDGVLKIDSRRLDRPWAAKVIDPAAVKPDYEFLDRVPGGYADPGFVPGDVLVWGGVGGSRRRPTKERYDRLVVEVTDRYVYTAVVDYASARRLRKSVVPSPAAAHSVR